MNDLEDSLIQYLALCERVPTFPTDNEPLYAALRSGDVERFKSLMTARIWLLVCHALEPLFEAAYGSPYLFWNSDAGELQDVWEPVIKHTVLRRR